MIKLKKKNKNKDNGYFTSKNKKYFNINFI